MDLAEVLRFRALIDSVIDEIDDEKAINVSDLFPVWGVGRKYYGPNDPEHAQSRVRYNEGFYKCTQTHTVTVEQTNYNPVEAVSLWARVDDPSEEWPEWKQPGGAGQGYPLGAKVSHNGKHWINVGKDDNEYEPGVWGWDEAE